MADDSYRRLVHGDESGATVTRWRHSPEVKEIRRLPDKGHVEDAEGVHDTSRDQPGETENDNLVPSIDARTRGPE